MTLKWASEEGDKKLMIIWYFYAYITAELQCLIIKGVNKIVGNIMGCLAH